MLTGEEVAQHSTKESCWVIIRDRVYDVTEFLNEHPGGSKIILKYAGKDATAEFEPIHPPDALETLPRSRHLGKVDPQTIKTTNTDAAVTERPVINPEITPLSQVFTVGDVEVAAEKSLKAKAWAYYKSAADDEDGALHNQKSWSLITFRPRVFVDVTSLDTSTTILGHSTSVPVFISPAAFGKLAHPDGEKALAKAAGKIGAVYMVSANASCSVEEIAEVAAPGQVLFYQLYVNRDRRKSELLLRRVEKAGYKAIVLTVDAPIPGKRTRDERAMYEVLGDTIAKPESVKDDTKAGGSVASALSGYIDASLNWSDLKWLRKATSLPIIIKGIQTAEDAQLCASHGIDGIFLSNHGGRQVEAAPSSLETLMEIRKFCPDVLRKCEIYMDGGVRKGSDVVKAIALGAKAVGIGRPAMYSLIWGEEGVSKVLQMLTEETAINMRLIGVTRLSDLSSRHVNTRRLESIIWDGSEGYPITAITKWNAKL